MPRSTRDHVLGAALSALDVPAHRPDFWEVLDDRLVEDRVARRSSRPAVAPARPAPVPPGPDPTPSPTPVVELVAPALRRSGRRRSPHAGRWLGAAAAAMAALALVAGVLALRSDEAAPPQQVATVGEVADQLDATLAYAGTISGTLTETTTTVDGPAVVVTSTFVRRADGSFRLTATDGSRDVAYDAASGVRRELTESPDGSVQVIEETGMSLGFPDAGTPGFVFADDLATIIRALDETSGATLDEVDRGDRTAWVIETPISPDLLGGPEAPDRVRLVIDRATVTPIEYTFFAGPDAVLEVEVADLALDVGADPTTFVLAVPEGVVVEDPIDYGFRRVANPHEAAAITRYDAAVPAVLPEGFELAHVGVASEAGPTGAEAANPPSVDVISLSYRRGFEQIVVTTRRAEDPEGFGWNDPFGTEGVLLDADEQVLSAGRFAGVSVELATTPPTLPHLWGEGPELVFTVSGSLDRDELVAVAESLS